MGLKNKKQSADLFKENSLGKIKEIKNNPNFEIPLYQNGSSIGYLAPVKKSALVVDILKEWRERNQYAFPTVFKVTLEGTEKWLEEQVMNREDRILFMVKNKKESYVGHLGLSSFDYEDTSCEIDNVIRGKSETKGIMTSAHYGLTDWAFSNLDLRRLTLRVFSDNEKAVSLYSRCGFRKLKDIPLKKVKKDEENWAFEEIENNDDAERYHSVMELISPYKSLEYFLTKEEN